MERIRPYLRRSPAIRVVRVGGFASLLLFGWLGHTQASNLIQSAYNLVKNGGSALTLRSTLNCGATITCTDDGVNNWTNLAVNTGGGSFVTSFNTRTGAVTLSTADVNAVLATALGTVTTGVWNAGAVTAPTLNTTTNCASAGGTCGSAASGSVSIAAAATTVTVNTSAVTANSVIIPIFDSSLGTKLSVTCNTQIPPDFHVSARSAGVSFTLTATAPTTNPACFSYLILN
jgi:hypothetical protein